jgi:hypothetical protein
MRQVGRPRQRWIQRGRAALFGVLAGMLVLLVAQSHQDVLNSDWTAFEVGGKIISSQPRLLYDRAKQRQVEAEITGGQVLVTIPDTSVLAVNEPPWLALAAAPFAALGTDLGGKLWGVAQLLMAGAGLLLLAYEGDRWRWLPGLAGVPGAVMMLNLQADGLLLLGLGTGWLLWRRQRPVLAGLALGLCYFKPHLVLPIGVALVVARKWPVLAGWSLSLLLLGGATALSQPQLLYDWPRFAISGAGHIGRELSLAGVVLPLAPAGSETLALAVTVLVATSLVLVLAARRRHTPATALAILIAGGLLAAPHAQGSDLLLLSAAAALWPGTRWFDWLALSIGSLVVVLSPPPFGSVAAVMLAGLALARLVGGTVERPGYPAGLTPSMTERSA